MRHWLASLALLLTACSSRPAPPAAPPAALPAAPRAATQHGVGVLRAKASSSWGDAIAALDRMKRAGTARFVLEVDEGDPARRTGELVLPRAGELEVVQGIAFLELARAGEATPGNVVLHAPADASYGDVVDAVQKAQAKGARVLFSIAPPQPATGRPADGFAACPFPAAADEAAIDEAFVVVEIDVDASGRATAARAVLDPGHGFGEMAAACALAASYAPGKRTTKMRVHFSRPPP